MRRYGDIRRLRWRGRLSERYYVRVVDGGRSTWRCTGFAERDLAEAVVHEWQMEAITGRCGCGEMRMANALHAWEADVSLGRREAYVRSIWSWVRMWTRGMGSLVLDAVSQDDISGWIAKRASEGKGPRTLNQETKLLRAFFAYCITRGWITRNPVIRKLRLPVSIAEPRILEPGDEERLLAAATALGARTYGYVLCLLTTGFRAGLAGELRWDYVDLDAGEWHIPVKHMKSRREYHQPVPMRLLVWLRAQPTREGRIFGGNLFRRWMRVRTMAGLPTLKRHDLRRNFITACRRAGVSIEVTMALADQTDLHTMLECYRRVDIDETRKALEKLNGDS